VRGVVAVGLAVALAAALVGTAVAASALSLLGVGGGAVPSDPAGAGGPIPPAMLVLYQDAAATRPGLPWTVLAAIGTVESDNGQSMLTGVPAVPYGLSGCPRTALRGECPSRGAESCPVAVSES